MAAAAQKAAAGGATAACFDLRGVDKRCHRLEARDTRRRAAGLRRLRRHLTRRVLTGSACVGPKARKHANPFGHLTKERNDGKELWEKWVVFLFFRFCLFCFGFLILVIRRFRILVFGKTTNHPSGLQWCPIPTPIWHAVNAGENENQRMGIHRDRDGQSDHPHVFKSFRLLLALGASEPSSACSAAARAIQARGS
jgi:hypothetical protein